MYKSTNDFTDLLKSNADLFFVDLEETLLAPNLYYKYISLPEYNREFLSLCGNISVNDMLYYGKNYRRVLFQKETKYIIEKLQSQGKMVFAFTSGYPSKQKRIKIRGLNIYFDGYLFTKGADKGPFLVNFLKKNTNLTGDCLFIDNDEQKIVNVYYYFTEHFQDSKNIDLLLYNRTINVKISMEGFRHYWNSVLKLIKKEKQHLNNI